MRSPRSRVVRAAAAVITAGTVTALVALSAPTFAADPSTSPSAPTESSSASASTGDAPKSDPINTGADLSVKIQSSKSTPGTGSENWMTKTIVVTVENNGPEDAEGVHVFFRINDYDFAEKTYEVESIGSPCSATHEGKDRVFACSLLSEGSTLKAGATNHEIYFAFRHDIKTAGDVAEGTVSVESKTPDPAPKNNTQPFTISIVNAGVDVSAYMKHDLTIDPGTTASFSGENFVRIFNEGGTPVDGVSLSMTLPAYASFEKDYANCQYSDDGRKANCDFPNITLENQEGMEFTADQPVRVTLAKNAPGPLSLGHVTATAAALGILQPQTFKGTNNAQKPASIKAAPQDQAPGDNSIEFTVFSTANPADLIIAATSPEGKVGDTVSVDVTVSNNGPADSPNGAVVTFTVPQGTTVTTAPEDCAKKSGSDGVWICETDATVPVSKAAKGTFKLKIDSKNVKDGKVTVESRFTDTDLTNNEAKVVVNVTSGSGGGLPVTGQSLTYIAVAAAALVVVGGALVLFTRRRRTEAAGVGDVDVLDAPSSEESVPEASAPAPEAAPEPEAEADEAEAPEAAAAEEPAEGEKTEKDSKDDK